MKIQSSFQVLLQKFIRIFLRINSVREITRACGELGIEYLTLYAFSKENLNRPQGEVSASMALLPKTIRSEVVDLKRNNVRLMTIGRLEDLPFLARQGMSFRSLRHILPKAQNFQNQLPGPSV
jgi:undecaprenyl diphosphate synthase